jgi:hypothetical protein
MRAKAPETGRGLSSVPYVPATECIHGVLVAEPCKRCEREIPRPKRSRS